MKLKHSYNEPDEAARDINTLLKFLRSQDKQGKKFVYRGQIKDWAGPLIPSIFRRSIQRTKRYTRDSSEYMNCLGGIGNEFIEMEPNSFCPRIFQDLGIKSIDKGEWEFLNLLANDLELSKHIAQKGYSSFFDKIQSYLKSKRLSSKQLWTPSH